MGPETDFSKAVYSPSSAGLRLAFAARHSPKQPCGLVGDGPRAPKRSGPSRAAGSQWPAAAQNSTAVNPGATHSRRKAGLARPEPGLPVFGGFGPGADACAFEAMKECPRREGPFKAIGLAGPAGCGACPSTRSLGFADPYSTLLGSDWKIGFPVRHFGLIRVRAKVRWRWRSRVRRRSRSRSAACGRPRGPSWRRGWRCPGTCRAWPPTARRRV